MQRRKFIQNTALMGGLTLLDPFSLSAGGPVNFKDFPVVKVAEGKRNFQSKVIEDAIKEFQRT